MPRQKPPKKTPPKRPCTYGHNHTGETDSDFWVKISKLDKAILCEFDTETQAPSYWLTLSADVCDIYVCAYEKWVNWLEKANHVDILPGRKRVDYVVVGEDLDTNDPPVIMVIEICEKSYLNERSNIPEEQPHDFQQVKYTIENACKNSNDPIGERIHVQSPPQLLYTASFDPASLRTHKTIGVVFPVLQTDVRQGHLPVPINQMQIPIYLLSILQTKGRQNPEIGWFELLEKLSKNSF